VMYGEIARTREQGLWRGEQFAVMEGAWEACRSGRLVIVGDVWLTNRAELLRELESHTAANGNARFAETGERPLNDLRIIALLWQKHAQHTPELLTGAFAFCVWDRERECLWLVRDRVGAETLYHTIEGATLYAGARLSDVAREASRELDLVAVRDYLCCAFVPGARTMWRGVRELRPGTIVRWPGGDATAYWRIQERIPDERLPLEAYGSRLRATLERVVRDCLPAGEPAGVYLSGGWDSSCVAALAARLHDAPVHSYSIHFGAECPNELEFSGLVARHCATTHHVIEITPAQMWDLLPETMAYLDDPIGDPLTVPNLILGRAAGTAVGTILNGEGGDPCFGGPKNQPMLLTRLYGSASGTTAGDAGNASDEHSAAGASRDLLDSYLASFQKCAIDLPRLLRAEVWQAVRDEESVFAAALRAPGNYLNKLMFINTQFKGADHILTKVNNMTRAVGLSGRSPLFDDRVVELSLEIPPEYKLEGAREKAVLKAAVADLLPQQILERPKSGMMVPVQRWFRERWRRRAAALLLSRTARTRRLLNQTVVRDWLHYRGDVWMRYGVKLWLLTSLELWLQAHTRD
jgi:asparagine synthase (glutamine-hydrolysing)